MDNSSEIWRGAILIREIFSAICFFRLIWFSIDFFQFSLVLFNWANGMKKVSNEGIMKATQWDVTAGVWTEVLKFLEKNN